MLTVLGIIALLFMLYFNRFCCSVNCIWYMMWWMQETGEGVALSLPVMQWNDRDMALVFHKTFGSFLDNIQYYP